MDCQMMFEQKQGYGPENLSGVQCNLGDKKVYLHYFEQKIGFGP